MTHTLTTMHDGKVLDLATDGSWRLWNYDAGKSDVLPGSPVAQGKWSSIAGHQLTRMSDGKVLDLAADGAWRLWNYDPGKADVLPGNPVAHGKWASIDSGHRLVTMRDGRVLDFVPANGGWRLWNYDASTADVLPGNPVAHGTWTSMADGGGAGGGARKVVELKHDSITFDNGVPVGGWSALVLRADGSFTYSGHFHDSGIPDYKVSDAWVVLDSEGWAYTFAEQGTVEGSNHLFGPDRDHDWAINGSNADLARRWGVLGDPRYRTTAKADMDTLDMIKTLVDEVEEIGGAVQKIVAVVGPIVAMV